MPSRWAVIENPESLLPIGRHGSRQRIGHALWNGAMFKSITRLASVVAFILFLAGPFLGGWMNAETDFPNYYPAAVLVREHQPLHRFYDWTWFARQMNYAGNGTQIGAYTPQTPLTMLPMVALAGFPPQTAKRIWLVCDLLFLGATIL